MSQGHATLGQRRSGRSDTRPAEAAAYDEVAAQQTGEAHYRANDQREPELTRGIDFAAERRAGMVEDRHFVSRLQREVSRVQ